MERELNTLRDKLLLMGGEINSSGDIIYRQKSGVHRRLRLEPLQTHRLYEGSGFYQTQLGF